jgi:hypothetical protein
MASGVWIVTVLKGQGLKSEKSRLARQLTIEATIKL